MSDQHSCVVCQRRIPNRPLVCDGDRQGLDSMLREIPDLFARLDPSPGAGGGPKVSGSREAPVPVSVDVVDLTSPARPGSVAVRMAGDWSLQGGDPLQVGYLSVATELDQWARDWISHDWCPGDHLPVPTVATLAGWLRVRLDTACDEHPAIDEFAVKIRQIHRALTRQVGEVKRTGERVGRCPAVLRDNTRCGTTLYVDPYVSQIACARCRTSWSSWLELMAAMEETGDEGSEAA